MSGCLFNRLGKGSAVDVLADWERPKQDYWIRRDLD